MTDEANEKKKKGGFSAAKEQWLKLVVSYPNLTASDYAVAVVLATYMNAKTRDAWPSMRTLATDTNRNRSTVWRSLERLEEFKLVEITHSRSRRKPNRYRMRLGDIEAKPETMRRTTTRRGILKLRARNVVTAGSQHIDCGLAARTSEEPQRKSGAVAIESQPPSDRKNLQCFAVAPDDFTAIPKSSVH